MSSSARSIFITSPEGETGNGVSRFESADVKLIADLQRLDEHHKQIAREFIRMLVRVNYQK